MHSTTPRWRAVCPNSANVCTGLSWLDWSGCCPYEIQDKPMSSGWDSAYHRKHLTRGRTYMQCRVVLTAMTIIRCLPTLWLKIISVICMCVWQWGNSRCLTLHNAVYIFFPCACSLDKNITVNYWDITSGLVCYCSIRYWKQISWIKKKSVSDLCLELNYLMVFV